MGERLRRWRLVLGGDAAETTGVSLGSRDAAMDGALGALYGKGGKEADAAATGRRVSGRPRRPSRAGWATSVRTFRAPSSR